MAENLLAKFVELDKEKRYIEEQLKEIKADIAELMPQVHEHMIDEGIQNAKVNGMTIYINRALTASGDRTVLTEALKGFGPTDFLVNWAYNASQLNAWMRELPRNDDDLPVIPDELKDKMNVHEQFAVRVRKS